MDELERLLKRQKRMAGKVTQKAKEGLLAAKKGLEQLELPGKKEVISLTPNRPDALRQELRGLYSRQMAVEGVLRSNRGKLISYKQLETAVEYTRKLDHTIHSGYYRDGGIRFHIETLLEHTELLDPGQDDVKTMVVRCYNSAIAYMRRDLQQMVIECDEWSRKLTRVKDMYLDDRTLKKALGYVDCADRLRMLKDAPTEELAREMPSLRVCVEANEQAVSGYMERCEAQLRTVLPEHTGLLEDIKKLLRSDTADALGTVEGWTPETYARAAEAYGKKLREELLEKYPLARENDGRNLPWVQNP